MPKLSQTSIIAGAMIVAYIVFITISGELPCYLQVLGIGTGAGGNCPSNVGGPNLYGGPGTTSASFGSGGPSIGISLPIGLPPISIGFPGFGGGF